MVRKSPLKRINGLKSTISALKNRIVQLDPERKSWISAPYVFNRNLAFTTIPKAYGFEAATHFLLILLGGSLIPIVVYRDGDGFPLAKHIRELVH